MLVDDQPPVKQEQKSSLNQECGHAHFKEEPEEAPTSELTVKQEPGDPEWTLVKEECLKTEDPTVDWYPEDSNYPVIIKVVSLSDYTLQEPSANSDDCQSQHQKGGKQKDPATKGVKTRSQKGHSNVVRSTTPSSTTCVECGQDFEDVSSLRMHLLSHIDKKQVVCKSCQLECPSHDSLLHHIKTHTVGRPHLCHTCGHTFFFKSALLTHIRKHTGENFSRQSHLNSHQAKHTAEKLYVCDTCRKDFLKWSHLKKHQLTQPGQRPHVCNTCEKGFPHPSGLKRHQLTHTGERPQVCNTCGKSFSLQSILKKNIS